MATARRIVLDLNPQIVIATSKDIKMVKMVKIGRAYFLKQSVKHPITIERARRPMLTGKTNAIFVES